VKGKLSFKRRHPKGFTLMEVLVAMGVFMFLGFGAMAFLIQGLRSWRVAERRRSAAERAELIFSTLRKDFACLYSNVQAAPQRAFFLSDYDSAGRQRLFFARSVPLPGADPRIALGGSTLAALDPIDGVNDLSELRVGRLGPPGDLMTVAYFTDGEENLYRAARTPEVSRREVTGPWFRRGGQLVSEGVMHIEFNFWAEGTEVWRPSPGKKGPLYQWDSTATLTRKGGRTGVSRAKGKPMGFPQLVEVKVVLCSSDRGVVTLLEDDISSGDKSIALQWAGRLPSGGEHFVKIDDEWIAYRKISRDGRKLLEVTRGRRNTKPAAHKAGSEVRFGMTFRAVFRSAYACEFWEKAQ